MTGSDPKTDLHCYLQTARQAVVWKLDGLSEYDIRRPLTPTGSAAEAWIVGFRVVQGAGGALMFPAALAIADCVVTITARPSRRSCEM